MAFDRVEQEAGEVSGTVAEVAWAHARKAGA